MVTSSASFKTVVPSLNYSMYETSSASTTESETGWFTFFILSIVCSQPITERDLPFSVV